MSSTMDNTHLFFCIKDDCGNTSTSGDPCVSCAEWDEACAEQAALYPHLPVECQMCGEMTAPGNADNKGWICDECFESLDHHHNCNERRDRCCCYRVGLRVDELKPYASRCTCDGSGRMCPACNEDDREYCRGCGNYTNLVNQYCNTCFCERYLPPLPPSPPPPTPRHTSLASMRAEIAEIEARILPDRGMTKAQKDDWIWILQNRRADLAEAEKEMWEQFDQDDLNKLDRQR